MSRAFSFNALVSQFEQLDINKDLLNDYKRLLKECRRILYEDYLNHSSAASIVKKTTQFTDRLLIHVWHYCKINDPLISLQAVGGYGRYELHPFSDIDLLISSIDSINDESQRKIAIFIRLLWDVGLEVGHSVRTLKQSIALAKKDTTVITNLMEARALIDHDNLTQQLLTGIYTKKLASAKKYTQTKLQEQIERHLAFDDTQYNLEPNIKDGPGGLRDIQTIAWVAARHYGKLDVKILIDQNILSRQEAQTLIRCRNFLWRLRAGLHFNAKRKEDRLLFDYQRILAQDFGYQDDQKSLAVEHLMKRYYRCAKEIRLLNETFLLYFQESVEKLLTRKSKINTHFNNTQGFIEASNKSVFLDYPPAFLEIFHLLQKNQKLKGIRANTIRLLRDSLPSRQVQLRKHPKSKEIFLQILKHSTGQTHALRRMDAYGVLAAFIPAYNTIVGQMQHDLFHVYTVDAHSLFVVRNIRRFSLAKHKDEIPEAFNVMAQVIKRERLYLAALLHDIAKGRGGDHSVLGEKEAQKFCKYLQLDQHDRNFVAWLVRHHLIMSWTAQREDISDSNVINSFAEKVGDQQHLDCLYLLTVADIKATSPKVWSRWKGKLIWDLYIATSRILNEDLPPSEDVSKRIANSKEFVSKQLRKNFPVDSIEVFWESFEPQYFLHFSSEAIIWQQKTLLSATAAQVPIVNMRYNSDLEVNQIIVYAPEQDALLRIISGGIDHLHLSIINAKIERLRNGMTLLALVVTDYQNEPVKDRIQIKQAIVYLQGLLRRGEKQVTPIKRLLSRRSKHFPIETQVSFTQSKNDNLTIMQVIAQDRPGLLYHVAGALLKNKVHLHTARINTLGERVEDHFFITDRDAQQIDNPKILDNIRHEIMKNL